VTYSPLKTGWYKIINSAFAYMVLGQYPAQGANQLISREWIARARSRWDSYVAEHGEKPPASTTAIMGQDVGEFGSDMSMSCFRYGGYVEQLIGWGEVDPISVKDARPNRSRLHQSLQRKPNSESFIFCVINCGGLLESG
jgi:hypothetical protein